MNHVENSWSPESAAGRLRGVHDRIQADQSDVRHVFTQLFTTADAGFAASSSGSPLAGALVSVKDLFDVAGYVTKAGTQFMRSDNAANKDATAIRKLREAGVSLIGHTNMTELAYSGLGINPHFGTPANALHPGCIPGGSTAGGAVSVALGLADIAIGTDTGGSLRIPAAYNGIVGFKPSQSAISRSGCKALSPTLDSVGPMAKSVYACKLAYQAMRDNEQAAHANDKPVFVVPDNFGMDDLDSSVAKGFDRAVQALAGAGYDIETRQVALLDTYKNLPIWQFSAVESRAEYDAAYTSCLELIDPRIASRMARADNVNAVEYRQLLNQRESLVQQHREQMRNTVLLMPTVPTVPPPFSAFNDDDNYFRLNLPALRNTSIANVMDGCSISLPCFQDEAPVGIMLTAPTWHDDWLLELAARCEQALR